jgi:uncharacterized protein involved in exopolysaccharide biosynthesis
MKSGARKMLLHYLLFLLEPIASGALICTGARLFQVAIPRDSLIKSKRTAIVIAANLLGVGVAIGIHFLVNLVYVMEHPK